MILKDFAPISGTRKTSDGYLACEARISKSGNIQTYAGYEVGRPDLPSVRLFRPESAVFDKASMASASHKPVTMGHPAGQVDAASWKATAVGWTGGDVARDGDFLKIPLMLADAAAIRAVEAGTRALSAGYDATISWVPGVSPSGEPFDGQMTAITLNHCAIVENPRCPGARIGDAMPQGTPAMITDAQTFADSAEGKAAMAYETMVADLNRRTPRTATELFADRQAAHATAMTQIAGFADTMPKARAAADAARADMIARLNGKA